MLFTDMDMLQDYEKDTRMAALSYRLAELETIDPNLRSIIQKAGQSSSKSNEKCINLILSKGDRP